MSIYTYQKIVHCAINFEKLWSRHITLTLGFLDLRYCPTPETVPPLPIPITNMSTCPFVSSQISGPVVSKCTCKCVFGVNYLKNLRQHAFCPTNSTSFHPLPLRMFVIFFLRYDSIRTSSYTASDPHGLRS